MIRNESKNPREGAHINPLKERPLPRIGFAADDGDRADALKRKDVKDHQRDSSERRVNRGAIRPLLVLQRLYQVAHA